MANTYTKTEFAERLGIDNNMLDIVHGLGLLPPHHNTSEGPVWYDWQVSAFKLQAPQIDRPNSLRIIFTPDGFIVTEQVIKQIPVDDVVGIGSEPQHFVKRWARDIMDEFEV